MMPNITATLQRMQSINLVQELANKAEPQEATIENIATKISWTDKLYYILPNSRVLWLIALVWMAYSWILPWMEVQATIAKYSARLVAKASLITKFSFIQETSALTRLVRRILLLNDCSENFLLLWHCDVVLTEQLRKVFPAENFTPPLNDKILVCRI